jgi:ketosteroid isomerase-like protein
MSRENVQLVERIFEAGGADSAEAVLAFVPPDVIWHPAPDWLAESDYVGHDGVREAMGVFTDTFDDYHAELHEARDAGAKVVALVWQSGVIKGSREPVRQAIGVIYSDFRDGRIGEAHFFRSWAEALEAAGLGE